MFCGVFSALKLLFLGKGVFIVRRGQCELSWHCLSPHSRSSFSCSPWKGSFGPIPWSWPGLSPFMLHLITEPWGCLINAPQAKFNTPSVQRGRICIPELGRPNAGGSLLFPSPCKPAWLCWDAPSKASLGLQQEPEPCLWEISSPKERVP